jgi:hypothetical protein
MRQVRKDLAYCRELWQDGQRTRAVTCLRFALWGFLKREWPFAAVVLGAVLLTLAFVRVEVVARDADGLAEELAAQQVENTHNVASNRVALCNLARFVRLYAPPPFEALYEGETARQIERREHAGRRYLSGIRVADCRPAVNGHGVPEVDPPVHP